MALFLSFVPHLSQENRRKARKPLGFREWSKCQPISTLEKLHQGTTTARTTSSGTTIAIVCGLDLIDYIQTSSI